MLSKSLMKSGSSNVVLVWIYIKLGPVCPIFYFKMFKIYLKTEFKTFEENRMKSSPSNMVLACRVYQTQSNRNHSPTFQHNHLKILQNSFWQEVQKRFLYPYFPYFSASGLNMEIYGVNIRIQSKYGKIRTRKTPHLDKFHAV